MNRLATTTYQATLLSAALIALLAGCTINGGPVPVAIGPTQVSSAAPSLHGTGSDRMVGVNNARDLAIALPESVLAGGPRDAAPADPGVRPLTVASLGEMLRGVGLKPEVSQEVYFMTVKASVNGTEYTYPITVSLSTDQTLVWICLNLKTMEANELVPPEIATNMLMANWELGGTTFSYSGKLRRVFLQRPLTNAGITADVLNYNLRGFFNDVKSCEPIYRQMVQPTKSNTPAKPNPFG